jgi:transmembrane sensor
MKTPDYINNLLKKFVENTITKKDFDVLMAYIKNTNSTNNLEILLNNYWKSLKTIDSDLNENINEESQLLFHQIMDEIDNKETPWKKSQLLKRIRRSAVVLATILISTLIGSYHYYQNNIIQKKIIVTSSPIVDPNAITLKLNDGSIKVISESNEETIVDQKGNIIGTHTEGKISYSNKGNSTEQLKYNELHVPLGKQLNLTLSDGTEVTLNAGTILKYPERFINGLKREVFLLEGEIYLNVSKDKFHPFIVNTSNINVEVLGTEFNMSSYPEDESINTVLVEGSVRLSEETSPDSFKILNPGHLASWNKSDKEMSIKKVDTEIYTAWKDGILLFKKSSYQNIRKKLSRHFDITIENNYSFLDSQVYSASFNKENSIEDILEAFKEDTPFKYTVENNKITITK